MRVELRRRDGGEALWCKHLWETWRPENSVAWRRLLGLHEEMKRKALEAVVVLFIVCWVDCVVYYCECSMSRQTFRLLCQTSHGPCAPAPRVNDQRRQVCRKRPIGAATCAWRFVTSKWPLLLAANESISIPLSVTLYGDFEFRTHIIQKLKVLWELALKLDTTFCSLTRLWSARLLQLRTKATVPRHEIAKYKYRAPSTNL